MNEILQLVERIALPRDRKRARSVLQKIASDIPENVTQLIELAEHPDASIDDRVNAVWLMEYLIDPTELCERLVRLIDSADDPELVFEATKILADAKCTEAAPIMIRNLCSSDLPVTVASAQALIGMGVRESIDPILKRAGDPEEDLDVRCHLIESFGELATREDVPRVAKALELLADDSSAEVRFACAYAMSQFMDPICKRILEKLGKDEARTPWGTVAEQAQRGLAHLSSGGRGWGSGTGT